MYLCVRGHVFVCQRSCICVLEVMYLCVRGHVFVYQWHRFCLFLPFLYSTLETVATEWYFFFSSISPHFFKWHKFGMVYCQQMRKYVKLVRHLKLGVIRTILETIICVNKFDENQLSMILICLLSISVYIIINLYMSNFECTQADQFLTFVIMLRHKYR